MIEVFRHKVGLYTAKNESYIKPEGITLSDKRQLMTSPGISMSGDI